MSETHFGARQVPLADKQSAGRRRFSQRRAPLRPDERPDVVRAAPRLEGCADHRARSAEAPPFALLDIAGGTGDIAFRAVAAAGGEQLRATVCDINGEMLAVGRERAAARALDDAVSFTEANAEHLPFADRSYDAVTIAFGIRNVPRIEVALAEAFRVLKIGGKFLCLEFSASMCRPRPALRSVFVQCHSGARPRGRGRRRVVSLSGRIDPPLPEAGGVLRDAAPAGFARVACRGMSRRHRGSALRLAFVISAPAHLLRLCRAGYVFARQGVFGLLDPAAVPAPARPLLRLARLIERPRAMRPRCGCRRR